MPQFFIDESFSKGSTVRVAGRDAHHIKDVLRLSRGDWLVVSDGHGKSFRGEIKEMDARGVDILVVDEVARSNAMPSPELAFALIKHDRTELIIQKAVELGCSLIRPFFSSRTIPKFSSNIGQRKLDRWQNIASEAAKQSGLPVRPQISVILSLEQLCDSFKKYDKVLIFWEGETRNDLKSLSSNLGPKTLVVIGPEGGFSNEEIELAKRKGALSLSLGRQILRVETAALTALAIVQYELGNLSA